MFENSSTLNAAFLPALGGFLSVSSEFWTPELMLGSLRRAVNRYLTWYRREFFSLFPPDIRSWLIDQGNRQLVLGVGERDLWCVDSRGSRCWRLAADEISASSLDEALANHSLTRAQVRIGLEIDAGSFFVRRFDLPSVALANLPRLLISEIERKTPFNPVDVIYGHTSEPLPEAPDKTRVALWILRKDLAADAATPAGLKISDISFIRAVGGDSMALKPTIELGEGSKGSHLLRKISLSLCLMILIFAAIGVGATLWRQSTINDELDSRITDMTVRATRVRQIVDKASAESRLLTVLRSARREPLFADVWEEIARILPDNTFLTEMRLSETKLNDRTIDIVGFASSAVGLPALFNKSSLFNEAALTSPITPDAHEKREGFSLQAKIERRPTENNK